MEIPSDPVTVNGELHRNLPLPIEVRRHGLALIREPRNLLRRNGEVSSAESSSSETTVGKCLVGCFFLAAILELPLSMALESGFCVLSCGGIEESEKEQSTMKKVKSTLCLLLAVLMILALAGCGGSEVPAETQSVVTTAPETTSPAEETAPAEESHYPVTVTTYDYEGNEITTTYEKAPEKVICVYQGCIETMIALGLEEHVIASYGLDNPVKDEWKEGLSKMNYNEEVFSPDKETVLMLEPDMIFSWGSLFSDKALGDQTEWIANGTNTYISSNTRRGGHDRTLENEYTDILNIGRIFDVEDKAQALVDEMKNEIANVLAQTAGQDAPSVAILEFLNDGYITNYRASQLGADMVKSLGGTLAEPEAAELGKEDLLVLDPDVIFVVYMARTENVEAEKMALVLDDPAFAELSAVKNGRVYSIMLGDMYAATVRSIDGIRVFAAGMYPELYQ